MWVHIGIFILIIFLYFSIKRRRIQLSILEDEQSKKLFFMVVLIGNIVGMCLTYENGSSEKLSDKDYLIRKENESYTETLEAKLEEEKVNINVKIPGIIKEEKEAEEEEQKEDYSLKARLSSEIVAINQENKDDDKYYLPQYLDGKKVLWERPGSTTGTFFSALCLIAGIVLLGVKENEKRKKIEQRNEELMMEYPNLVMKLTLLIQAGMTVRLAFHKIAKDYEKMEKKKNYNLAYEEMIIACYEMDSGVSESDAYERFASRCGPIKYKTLSTLLVQNLHRGSRSLLEMLEKESMEAFEDRKRKAKVLGESATTKLLVPMILMLLVVLAIIMIPAILSFYGG